MVSGRSVTGLKSVIYFLNSHGRNNKTSKGDKNFKKGKDRDMVPRNKKKHLLASCHN